MTLPMEPLSSTAKSLVAVVVTATVVLVGVWEILQGRDHCPLAFF